MIRHILLPIGLCVLIPLAPVQAQPPPLLNYQGHLQTASDSLLDGSVQIVFSIYNVETGGVPLWSKTHTIEVMVGRFHALLGSLTPFPETLFAQSERYLALKIDDDQELLPRQRIVSVAYALRSAQANDVSGRDISPKSISLSGGKASIDPDGNLSAARITADSLNLSAVGTVVNAQGNWVGGNVTAPQIATDSLVVGGKGIVDRTGQWTGPPIQAQISGMVLENIIVTNVQDSLLLFSSSRWQRIDDFTTFVRVRGSGFLDIQFSGAVTTGGSFQTRLVILPLDPSGAAIQNAGNISRVSITGGTDLAAAAGVSNSAVVTVTPGTYRVFVERLIQGNPPRILEKGILIIRAFTR